MAKTISELTAAGTLTGAEQIEVVQAGASRRATLSGWTGALAGDINITGTGRKITADASSSPGRLVVQNSITNSPTIWTLVPNGTAIAQFNSHNSEDFQNSTLSRCGVIGAEVFHTGHNLGSGAPATLYRWGPSMTVTWAINSTGNMLPAADAAYDAGSASLRLKGIFCSNATINTSDAREKTSVRQLTTAERAAARALLAEIGIYQFLASVSEKGEDDARLHTGMTVQRAIEVMEAHGLDPMRYGFICHDEWPERVEEIEDPLGDQVRIVPQQATIDTELETSEIELIDGMPTLVCRPTVQRTQATELRAVVAEDGTPVLGEDAQPLMYPVPLIRDVEQRFRRVVTPAGDRYSFRETRLILFILAGITESL